MEEVMLSQKEEKKRFKKEINKLARVLIYYMLAMFLPTIINTIYLAIKYMLVALANGNDDLDFGAYGAAVDASTASARR